MKLVRGIVFLLALAALPRPAFAASWQNRCDPALESSHSGVEIADEAGLHYITPGGPGITRVGSKDSGFTYYDSSGKKIDDPASIQRIDSLGIPPGYHDVWISPDPESHIQATALDAKGREQYRYHPKWIAAKSKVKFSRMLRFGNALPAMHEAEEADLGLSGLPRDKVLATLAGVMEKTSIRVGNARYAAANESFGLTTLLNDQVRVTGDVIHFSFKGKSGIFHEIDLEDAELAKITRRSLALRQTNAFEYLDPAGNPHPVDSSMLNEYLQKISGGHFTAKDFRTWGGTTFAAKSLLEAPAPRDAAQAEANIDKAVEYASSRLGNTPAICRSNYIDPRLLSAYMSGDFQAAARSVAKFQDDPLKPEERLVLLLLQ